MAFVRFFTYVTEHEPDMGMPIDPETVERIEVAINPEFVVYVEAKPDAIGGCDISMANGEFVYVDETLKQVLDKIEKASGIYPRSN